ncbi:MAG TPA: glycosyltransferase [Gemmatimonadaceae bacterium]|jgi:glycosyltransferase involved in cell wall biosynthesis
MLSIVVPVHDSEQHLQSVLAAIVDSELRPIQRELIVVDDASSDDSAEIAAGYADLVIRLTGQARGPAYARNRGVEAARGEFIAFVDADVVVAADALRRMIDAIAEDPTIAAVMGACCSDPAASSPVSAYRNLLREFEHRSHPGESDTMSAGLLLVSREALHRVGIFDEWRFLRPQVEALELGDRLRAAGFRIYRDPQARATHLKVWTLRQWIAVDLVDRGVAVARLNQPRDFRARAQRFYLGTPLDGVLALAAIAAPVWIAAGRNDAVGISVVTGGLFAIRNWELFAHFARRRGLGFAGFAVLLQLVASATQLLSSLTGRLLYHTVGEPQPDPLVQAWAEVGVRMWPPVPAQRGKATLGLRALATAGDTASDTLIDGAATAE